MDNKHLTCLPPHPPRHSHVRLFSPLFSHTAMEEETLSKVVCPLNPPLPYLLKDLLFNQNQSVLYAITLPKVLSVELSLTSI